MLSPSLYSISELAALAEVTPRTVHYYIAQGLLPSPGKTGPGAHYGEAALARLKLIRLLQEEHLPLAEIRARLSGLDDDAVISLAVRPAPPPRPDSALAYIQRLKGQSSGQTQLPAMPPAAPVVASSAPTRSPDGPARSQWDRIQLSPDVEVHVRRPLSRADNRRVDELLAHARTLFEKEKT